MIKDRNKIKRIVRTLRWIAKNDLVIKWKSDPEYANIFILSQSQQSGGVPIVTLNTLFLYRSK